MFITHLLQPPARISVETDSGYLKLSPAGVETWQAKDIRVLVDFNPDDLTISFEALNTPVQRIYVSWDFVITPGWRFLGDAWERGYGDLEWRGIVPERVMPWYVVASDGRTAGGFGVKTGGAALAYWQVHSSGVRLVLDVRCGGQGVMPGERRVAAATVTVLPVSAGLTPFTAAQALCARLCDHPRLPGQPVYGSNDWYYRYGSSTQVSILEDGRITADLSPDPNNRPYVVIDAGWQVGLRSENDLDSGDRTRGNSRFPDLPGLATELKTLGVHPGMWVRPLIAPKDTSSALLLKPPSRAVYAHLPMLDPSLPENLASIAQDIRQMSGWGYDLIKHDFTTVDLLGRWGFEMGAEVTSSDWAFGDRSRTSAEIIRHLYQTLRDAAGEDTLLIGCNTIGHLGAGLFELQRTGDDTSGREWERTRKMGINTLAFRMPQHGAFFFTDADCVGLTPDIAWKHNQDWLDLLARSGTPLFVSADPQALGSEQKRALTDAYRRAAQIQPCAEPLDWMDTVCPTRWQSGEEQVAYDWFSKE